jgi:hypothetical protein
MLVNNWPQILFQTNYFQMNQFVWRTAYFSVDHILKLSFEWGEQKTPKISGWKKNTKYF